MRFIEKGLLSGKLTQRLITAGGVIIALAVMLSLLPLSAASAAEVPDNIATNITLTDPVTGNEVSEVQARGKYQLNIDFKVPNGVNSGDTSTITLPDEFKYTQEKLSFDVKDSQGNVVAKATFDPSAKKMILTYTDYVKSHSDISGKLTVPFAIDITKATTSKDIPVNIQVGKETVKKGTVKYPGPVGDKDDEIFTKWGKVEDPSKNEITYTIRVNARGDSLKNVVATDKVASDGMSIVPGSFKVVRAKQYLDDYHNWLSKAPITDITSSSTITVAPDGKSFKAAIGDLDGVGAIITYTVKLNFKPVNGEIFTNKANSTADGKRIGIEEIANTTWQSGSGEANGYEYSISIKKTDPTGAPLAGAVFKIVRDRSGSEVATVTTDASGNASVSRILRDDYTITEVTAPDGYTLDTTPVKVTADELKNGSKSVTKTIVNNKKGEITISGTKTWDDNNNADNKRPASITVNLLADGVKIESLTVTAATGWKYTFPQLPESKDGRKIVYTVTEEAVEGYTAKVDGYNITNTYKPVTPPTPTPNPPTPTPNPPTPPVTPPAPNVPEKPAEPKKPAPKPRKHLAQTGAGIMVYAAGGFALLLAGIVLALRRRKGGQEA